MGKKKGRVSGTIGFILALALVGGTVAYSVAFDRYAAAKADKPIGDSTGNIVSAYTKKEGLEKTKTLASDTLGNWFSNTSGVTYKSFSLDFDMTSDVKTKQENKTTLQNIVYVGSVYADAMYTYMKLNARTITNENVQAAYTEFFYRKSDGKCYTRALDYAQNPSDTSFVKGVEWTEADASAISAITSAFDLVSTALSDGANWKFNYVSGQFEWVQTVKQEGAESSLESCFTVGTNPYLSLKQYMADSKKENEISSYVSLQYSALNNTVVNVPETLKSTLGV